MSFRLANTNENAPRIKELLLARSEPASDLILSSFAGRTVILFVFGVDCGTCKHLAGLLSGVRDEYGPEVECIGVCVQTGCGERLEAFRESSGASLPLASCRTREIYSSLGIPPSTWLFYPSLVFIDHEQRMRGCVIGGDAFFENAGDNIRAALKQLLPEELSYAACPKEVRL